MRRFDGDPIEALRRADPLHHGEVPTDTKGAHARALFQEVTSMETIEKQAPPARRRSNRRLAFAGSAALVAAVTVAAISLFSGDGTAPEEHIVGGVPLEGMASCVELYDLETLTNREYAFDGTVTAISGDRVIFAVERWFKGGSAAEADLNHNGLASGGMMSVGGPGLELGDRYLVSGSGGFVWACGFTMTYDTDIAGQWADAFQS